MSRAIADGTVGRLPCEAWQCSAGDAVFVPAGTAHTICPGVVLCEIQQHSDITYRVFDYNRVGTDGKPRDLHIRQALNVMRFGEQSGGRCEPVRITHGAVTETFYAACRHFATERWEFRERIAAVTSPEHFDLLIFLEGTGPHRVRRWRRTLRTGGSLAAPGGAGRLSTGAGIALHAAAHLCARPEWLRAAAHR